MRIVELRLNEKQQLITLLYLAKRTTASHVLNALDGCEEMSVLRLQSTAKEAV